jgi:hypothetical protein
MCAVSPNDSQDRAVAAVTRITGSTQVTLATAYIDFSDYPLAQPGFIRSFLNHPDKLVTDCSLESCVPSRNFEICVADA